MTTMTFDAKVHTVLNTDMDQTHQQFVALVNKAMKADKEKFLAAYDAVIAHTEDHFAQEETLMEKSGFRAKAEHKAEHGRVLRDLRAFRRFAAKGMQNPARAFLRGGIPEWFSLHLSTMDMALSAHLAEPDAKTHRVA